MGVMGQAELGTKVGSGKAQEERVWDGVESFPTARWAESIGAGGKRPGVGKDGSRSGFNWEMVGKRSENGAAFPTSSPVQPAFSHVIRRKSLISRI